MFLFKEDLIISRDLVKLIISFGFNKGVTNFYSPIGLNCLVGWECK
jgi:hypothetical protein